MSDASDKIAEIISVSTTNTRNTEEIELAAEHLDALTNNLSIKLEKFKT